MNATRMFISAALFAVFFCFGFSSTAKSHIKLLEDGFVVSSVSIDEPKNDTEQVLADIQGIDYLDELMDAFTRVKRYIGYSMIEGLNQIKRGGNMVIDHARVKIVRLLLS